MSPNPRALAELLEQIVRATYKDNDASQLNPAQWWALRYLGRTSAGLRTPAALAQSYLSGRSTVSQTLASLVAKGLVVKHRDDHDGRSRRLALTPAGRALLRRDPINRLAAAIAGLSALRQVQAAEIAEALAPHLFQARRTNGLWREDKPARSDGSRRQGEPTTP